MRLYLALFLPFLPMERLRRCGGAPDEGTPFALVEKRAHAQRLFALDPSALEQGLTPGLSLSDARARAPCLCVAPADHSADRALLLRLAARCERYTPLVALDEPYGVLLDISGCAHLFGGEEAMRARLIADFSAWGFTARAAVAPAPDCARALARFSPGGIFIDHAEGAVARLPLAALEADEDVHFALARAGFRTLGDLAARPARGFAARFGNDFPYRLERLFGRADRRITPLRPPPERMVERHFLEPVSQREALESVIGDLLREVAVLLEQRGEGGRGFELSFFRADGHVRRLGVETLRPTRDDNFLGRLFSEKLDSLADPLDPGFGFDALRLAVPRAETCDARQESFGGASQSDAERELSELLDRLTTRFGRARVLRFMREDAYEPERESFVVPASAPPSKWPAPIPGEPPTRPLALFDPPQPVEVVALAPDGPPARFRWRRKMHDVLRAEGPERIAPDWRAHGLAAPERDYYRVEDREGRRFWLFRQGLYERGEGAPRWFLHGLFA
jgi:protein ImuB